MIVDKNELNQVLRQPSRFGDVGPLTWFASIAKCLLTGSKLLVDGKPHQIAEVEFYYHCANHADPFTHRDPLQKTCGEWYFHRIGQSFRGGSFKGLDLTFGSDDSYGGVLIRSIERPDGTLVSGPSLCVDHLIKHVGVSSVAELDAEIIKFPDRLAIAPASNDERHCEIFNSARVGLTLKRATDERSPRVAYSMRPYRFLTRPADISKGRPLLVLALHAGGRSIDEIRQCTKSPLSTIERYIQEFDAGRELPGIAKFLGVDLKANELCRLHGYWHRRFTA